MIAPTPIRPPFQALAAIGRVILANQPRFGLGRAPGPPKPSTGWRYRLGSISYQLQVALDQHEDRPYPEVAA